MSAIVIRWVNTKVGYEHTALLLNNLGTNQTLYISIYDPGTKSATHRFTSQTFEHDAEKNSIVDYVVIPTCEDGNKFGLSEGVIAKYWMELYSFKKTSHQEFIAENRPEETKSEASNATSTALNSSPEGETSENQKTDKTTGKQNALIGLSTEFEKFVGHLFFNPGSVLDCTKFIAKLLQKGGLDLFSDPKLLNGYIGVTQFIDIAQNAALKIIPMQNYTQTKDPKFIKEQTATWSDRRSFR